MRNTVIVVGLLLATRAHAEDCTQDIQRAYDGYLNAAIIAHGVRPGCIVAMQQAEQEGKNARARKENELREQHNREASIAIVAARDAREKAAKEKADADRAKEIQAAQDHMRFLAEHPKAMPLALSTGLCIAQQERRDAMAEIAKHRKYASLSGVVRLRDLDELRSTVESADERIESIKTTLKDLGAKAIGCNKEAVELLWECAAGSIAANCQDPLMVKLVTLVPTAAE